MARPLMQKGVGQLEEMFAKSKADNDTLRQLESELQYRQVPRAVALLAEVQAALQAQKGTSQPASTPPVARTPVPASQPGLWDGTTQQVAPASESAAIRPIASGSQSVRPLESKPAPKSAAPSAPEMPIDDAYKLLKATAGSTWGSIEQTRRALVLLSHPQKLKSMGPEARVRLLAEAKRVNSAYATLSRLRCEGH